MGPHCVSHRPSQGYGTGSAKAPGGRRAAAMVWSARMGTSTCRYCPRSSSCGHQHADYVCSHVAYPLSYRRSSSSHPTWQSSRQTYSKCKHSWAYRPRQQHPPISMSSKQQAHSEQRYRRTTRQLSSGQVDLGRTPFTELGRAGSALTSRLINRIKWSTQQVAVMASWVVFAPVCSSLMGTSRPVSPHPTENRR